jgi:DNA-binding phage protein
MPRIASKKAAKTPPQTTPYDVAEHLRTPEEMAAYLDAWLDEAPDDWVAATGRDRGAVAAALGRYATDWDRPPPG